MRKGSVKKMNLYFKTRFTKPNTNAELISLAIISENNKRFYAEFTDFDRSACKNSVLKSLMLNPLPWTREVESEIKSMRKDGWEISQNPYIPTRNSIMAYSVARTAESGTREVCGDSCWVEYQLTKWISQFDFVQFISDVCHYDFVLLIDLFGAACNLPENISPVCHDLNFDIATYYGISEKEAFDKSREKIVENIYGQGIEGDKHNALHDSEVIKAIYEEIFHNPLTGERIIIPWQLRRGQI